MNIKRVMKLGLIAMLAIFISAILFALFGCEEPSDSDDDQTTDNDNADDDVDDDADDDFEPWQNPEAKADAFRLFYKERMSRVLLAYNRFALVNDVVPAHTLGAVWISRQGNRWEVILHPKDNNDIGFATFNTYQAYKVFRTRELALTLIRMFEGLVVAEGVSGHPGLTCREWEPAWTMTINGLAKTVSRIRNGEEVEPAEKFPKELEDEIISAFFNDVVFTYRADPTEYYFTAEPLMNTGEYAVTFVFTDGMPDFLRISNCCSSFMVSKLGKYKGYFWGNHNSRDNFPDYAMGYLAACECMNDKEADADVRWSARRACEAGRRIGDSVVLNGYNLMTVPEFRPYNELIVAGAVRPDGRVEPEDLGSMNSCQMSYMAKALSSWGLHSPNEYVEAPGSYETLAIRNLLKVLGIDLPLTRVCHNLDDAYGPFTWKELLEFEIFGISLFDMFKFLLNKMPDDIVPLLLELAEDLHQPEESAYVIVYYAMITGQKELLLAARKTLYHILEIHRRVAQMLIEFLTNRPGYESQLGVAKWEYYLATIYAHIYGVGDESYDPGDFENGLWNAQWFEAVLSRSDSQPLPLLTNEQIWQRIERELSGSEPWIVERYYERFGNSPPLRRFGDHYEAVGLDGEFHEIPNLSHYWFGGFRLWFEIPMCSFSPTVLDCSWALLGCERPDLNGDKTVDGADQSLFDEAWVIYQSSTCDDSNNWCGGADLDRNGALDSEDQAFMQAAQGCWY